VEIGDNPAGDFLSRQEAKQPQKHLGLFGRSKGPSLSREADWQIFDPQTAQMVVESVEEPLARNHAGP
jgi:hypothetical protein